MRRLWGGGRCARPVAVGSLVVFAVCLFCQTGSSAEQYWPVQPSSLRGDALVVSGGDWLFLGQRAAAEQVQRWSPRAVFARERSRGVYAHLGGVGVGRLLRSSFPSLFARSVGGVALPAGARVRRYATAYAASLSLPGDQLGVVESMVPIAVRAAGGGFASIDLGLRRSGGGFAAVRSSVAVRVPAVVSSGVGLSGVGVSLTPVDRRGRALGAPGQLVGGAVVYANVQGATDAVVKPTAGGFDMGAVLRSEASPQVLYYRVGAPVGSRLVGNERGGVEVVRRGRSVATIMPPTAVDSAGMVVPASMRVQGRLLVVSVDHRAGSYLYPIEVDPEVVGTDNQLVTNSSGKAANWLFGSSSSSFGHRAVYEGSTKEFLETTGVASYSAGEYAAWAYETKGNSQIYEVKTKTSAKNSGNGIESVLQFATGSTKENWKSLSNEFTEPEYSEKSVQICPAGSEGKELCLPGTGKQKNSVLFQQSVTKTTSNYGFSDSMSEAVVMISEPAGEHAAASFDTKSPKVRGEVVIEGKKVAQERENALYGSGVWISDSQGALSLLSKDPGVGVAKTWLEYEKSVGKWERLSEHNYVGENACAGIQCNEKNTEYWTLDPKLPNGEDKIRYRAEEAIEGTRSLESEPEDTETVKVDTSKPYNVALQGLPSGEELTERPYTLKVEATDGEGSVASSGIEGIKLNSEGKVIGRGLVLRVDGSEKTETGTQTGCTIAAGACTASATWTLNAAELSTGRHAIEVIATDNAGNTERAVYTILVRHSTPVALGPGSVDLQSGDFTMSATDVEMGSGLQLVRNYSSRHQESALEGPFGRQWSTNFGTTQQLQELPDHSIMLTDATGEQTIFTSLGSGGYEPPFGDFNLKLTVEENKETKEKLAFLLEDAAKHTKTTFTMPTPQTKVWYPSKKEGTTPTDTVSYSYRTAETSAEYPLASGKLPTMITAGPDGAVWFVEGDDKVGRITSWGAISEYALKVSPRDITVGPDGNLWYTAEGGIVGKITTGGTTTEWSTGLEVRGITVGPDKNLWFTGNNHVGRITPAGEITKYLLVEGVEEVPTQGIATGSDGDLWITSRKGVVYKMTTSGSVKKFTLSSESKPQWIIPGPGGQLWYTNSGLNTVGAMNPATGSTKEFSVPAGSEPYAISAGSDGNIWYTEKGTGKIGKMNTSGTILAEYSPTSGVTGIAAGPEGYMWITSEAGKKIDTIGTITQPAEVLAPAVAGVSCGTMKAGCRALHFDYASSTTANGENESGWGEYKNRLQKVLLDAYNPATKSMQETAISEYSYDIQGRLRAQWDPRISPALETTYGYDPENHVVALTPPGQATWAFTYGSTTGEPANGRLLKVTRADASSPLWDGKIVKYVGPPTIMGSPVVGVRMATSNGVWYGSPFAYSYQWESCVQKTCAPIVGAINRNYTPVEKDAGKTLVVRVTAINGGDAVTASSMESGVVEDRKATEYALPAGSDPTEIADGDGELVFSEAGTGGIGGMTETGTLTGYAGGKYEPAGIVYAFGDVWQAELGQRKINKLASNGKLTEYAISRAHGTTAGIAVGPDNYLWFTEYGANYIGKMNTSGEIIDEYALPAGSKPYGIVAGPDGNLWFTECGSSKIGKITTSGVVTEYPLPESDPHGITVGPNGNIWFAETGSHRVGEITPTGVITEFQVGGEPFAITNDTYGKLWFTETGPTGKIGSISPSGAVTEFAVPYGSEPHGIALGEPNSGGRLLWFTEYGSSKIASFNPQFTEEARANAPAYAIEYNVPLRGEQGEQSLAQSAVEKWGQTDDPVEATAILPPDASQAMPVSNYSRAAIYYLDSEGRLVNRSVPSNAPYGSVTTTEYNEYNDVARTLSADNRQRALEAGRESVNVAKSLSTYYMYRGECSEESENNHEREDMEFGARLCEVEGPQHMVRYVVGKEQREELARQHVKYFYDENVPSGEPYAKETYNLLTETRAYSELSAEGPGKGEEVEGRVMQTSYSGQGDLGWRLRAPTSTTFEPAGLKITRTTLYNEAGQVTEARGPRGQSGGSAHDGKTGYYTAEANTEGFSACGYHPEWAGLACETKPAEQPGGGSPPLPVTVTTYNMWDQPLTVTETFGTTVRTKTNAYDGAGRLTSSETTSSADLALPKVTDEYNTSTGSLEKASTTVGGKTQSITSKYNTLGQMVEYTDADGNITKYRYAGPENDWLLEEVADGSDGGTGKQTYSYDPVTKARDELVDSAAGTFTASYDAGGRLTSEVYPNGMCANTGYNAVGEAVHLEYVKTSNCGEHGAPVWFSETRSPSVRGETFARSSTLASEAYYYDSAGRLTETQETPAGEGCSTRLYGYDEESNRVSQITRGPGVGGKCASEGGTVQEHRYDEANRLTDEGVGYDAFGNMTKVPAADAEGHELSSSFYVDNAVASQTQNGVSDNYYLDPQGRVRETVSGASATITHYDGAGSSVAWTSEPEGKSTRNIPGIEGALAAIQTNGGTPVLQLHDLQGDVTATAALSTTETKLLSTYNNTEFGVPNKEKAPPKYSWLGATDVMSTFSTGVITYGSVSYVPQIAMPVQSEGVETPSGIAPGGTGAETPYIASVDPAVWQAAASAAAEAPGREAAREREAAEAAINAALGEGGGVDPHRWFTQKEAVEVGEKLNAVKDWGEVWGGVFTILGLTDPIGAVIGATVALISSEVMEDWLHNTGGKLEQCGKNREWWVVGCELFFKELPGGVINFYSTSGVEKCGTYVWYRIGKKLDPGEAWECRRLNEKPGPV